MTRATDRMIQLLEDIRDNTASGEHGSSIEIEDLASKPEPKITTKTYPRQPLTIDDIDRCLAAHAYAKRRIRDLALTGWQETIDMLKVRADQKPTDLECDLEELPSFDEVQQP